MKKNEYPVFNVIYDDSNNAEFVPHDVFRYTDVRNLLDKYKKKPVKERKKEEFAELLRREFAYHMWGKCEAELILKEWVGRPHEKKIDGYWQVMLNWNTVVNLGWDYCKPRKEI